MRVYFSGEGGDHDVPERLCLPSKTKKPHVMLTFHNILKRDGNTSNRLGDFVAAAKTRKTKHENR